MPVLASTLSPRSEDFKANAAAMQVAIDDLNATLAPRLLFLDSSVDVHQAEIDPYSSRAENSTTSNRRTSSTYRVTLMPVSASSDSPASRVWSNKPQLRLGRWNSYMAHRASARQAVRHAGVELWRSVR